MDTTILIIPGLHNSGPDHWQTHFERELRGCVRVEQSDWETPACSGWICVLDTAIRRHNGQVLLAAHSLGCATVGHWAARYKTEVAGALLVAPSDVEAPSYPPGSTGFTPMPLAPLRFPSIVVASRTDPYLAFERAQYFARCWGSELVDAGDAGHLNTAAGYGPWPHGKELLSRLKEMAAGLGQ